MKKFPAKILLFGEYAVLRGGMALAIPFKKFSGELHVEKSLINSSSNIELKKYYVWLKNTPNVYDFDLHAFEKDIENGLHFKSNIPEQSGLGSSGALVAALVDRYLYRRKTYLSKKPDRYRISTLRKLFSKLENYFHGSSSGFDPLVSYIGKPLFMRTETNITIFESKKLPLLQELNISLMDTGVPGGTGSLVQTFLDNLKNPSYQKLVRNIFLPASDNCIKSFLEGDYASFFFNLQILADFEINHMATMFPAAVQEDVKRKQQTGNQIIKLCGSGGGGFLLVFSKEKANSSGLQIS
jgi:mevalonate kinase